LLRSFWSHNCMLGAADRGRRFAREVLPAADEVFLREYRYRGVVFSPAGRNLLTESAG
jgi:hypothetical protein